MKKRFKKQLLTGLAAIALVAPLVLGGINGNNNVHAAGTPQLLANANNTDQSSTNPQTTAQPQSAQTSQGNGQAGGQTAQNNKPTKTITPQQLKQMLAKQAAKQSAIQKKQLAKELKGSMDIFVAQGNEVYTAKAKGTQLFQPTMKKYMSLRQFKKVRASKIKRLRYDQLRYRATRNKKYFQNYKENFRYMRFGRIPTQKQLVKMQQKQAKLAQAKAKKQGKSSASNNVKKANVKKSNHKRSNKKSVRHHRRNRLTRKSHRKARRIRRAKKAKRSRRIRKARHTRRIARRITRSRRRSRKNRKKRARSATTFYKNHQVYLKSEFKRGSKRAAKRTGFIEGPSYNKSNVRLDAVFDHYKPNDRRAMIPKNYPIRPYDTIWTTGHYTRNFGKINRMKNLYYYNSKVNGWANVGSSAVNGNK